MHNYARAKNALAFLFHGLLELKSLLIIVKLESI